MSDATVLRESANDGYYMVLPSMGKGEVEAIDMQRAGFSAKAKATIIQIGSEYGIVSKLKGLTGVLAVPADSRKAVALKNPAQFALAYFATLLGNIKRAYAVAEVLSVGAKTMLLKYAGGIDNGKQFYAAPMAGLSLGDFETGESVAVSLLQVAKPAVCGWWSAVEIDPEAETGGPTSFTGTINFVLRNKYGSSISGSLPRVAYVEYGRYVFTGDEDGIPGTFEPFALRENAACEDVNGELIAVFDPSAYLPNQFRLTYFYDDEWLTKTFNMPSVPISMTADFATLSTPNGVVVEFTTEEELTVDTPDFSANLARLAITFIGSSILRPPFDLQWGYLGIGLEGVGVAIQTNGRWSVRGDVTSTSPGEVYNTSSGRLDCYAPASPKWVGQSDIFKSRAAGTLNTVGMIVYSDPQLYGLEYDLTTDIDCDSYPSVGFELIPKNYTPTVTAQPTWDISDPGDDLPESVTVSGAGTAAANGVYALEPSSGAYFKGSYAIGFGGTWMIVEMAEDMILLYSSESSNESEVPTTGWQAVDGEEPAPTVAY